MDYNVELVQYSEVAIKCEAKAYEMFKQVINQENQESFSIKPDKIYKDREMFIIYWSRIKWCDGYSNIKAIIEVMTKLDIRMKEDEDYGYAFVRLGESNTDIETRSNDYRINLQIVRKIDIPDGLELHE